MDTVMQAMLETYRGSKQQQHMDMLKQTLELTAGVAMQTQQGLTATQRSLAAVAEWIQMGQDGLGSTAGRIWPSRANLERGGPKRPRTPPGRPRAGRGPPGVGRQTLMVDSVARATDEPDEELVACATSTR